MQIKPRGPAFESFEQLFCNFNISYTHVFVTRERAHVNVLETQTNWNHSIYRCINNVADAKCKRSLRKFGSWITFPTPHFFPCCTLNEVQWYVEGGRERDWTVNPENSDSRIRKMPAIANPTLPFPDILHFLELIFRARAKDFEFDFSCPSKWRQTSWPNDRYAEWLFDKSI